MSNHEICPYFETCVVSNLLKAIEVPEVLRYCAGNYHNCRYLPRSDRRRSFEERWETAEV
jgi:hypothetical protein